MLNLTGFKKFEQDSKLVKRLLFLEEEWRRAFPLVDLQKQMSWSHVWLVSSGKKYTDMARFLTNWFRRCQEDAEVSKIHPWMAPKPYKEDKPKDEDVMTDEDWKKMKEAI